jgi:hypothetical protein
LIKKLSALNIKYYNSGLNFDITEFCSGNINVDAEGDTLDDTRATSCPKLPPSKAVNAYEFSQYVVQPSSLDLSLELPSTSPEEREELPPHS